MRKSIAIVVPIYREAGNLWELYRRIKSTTDILDCYDWQFVMVNDGSPDNSLDIMDDISKGDHRFKVIDLSRNFGKEIALTAGVHEVEGVDAVICIDADLQHPPELIPELISNWEQGAEVVVTIRKRFDKQPVLKRIGSHGYYWLMNKISEIEFVSQATDYRLYDKKVVEAFKAATERERMFRGIMDWMGFRRVYIEFDAPKREVGEAGYSYAKLWRLAVCSITSFSLWPLRMAGYFGLLITTISGLTLAWMSIHYITNSKLSYTPLAIIVVANTFFMGIVLMAIGLVAIYIGTIHTEVINRPLYIIRSKLNFD